MSKTDKSRSEKFKKRVNLSAILSPFQINNEFYTRLLIPDILSKVPQIDYNTFPVETLFYFKIDLL